MAPQKLAKKARLDIKTEAFETATVEDEDPVEELSYIETNDITDKQFCITSEEREVLEREGNFFELQKLKKNLKKSQIFFLEKNQNKRNFRMGVDRKELEKSSTKDQEQDFGSRITQTKTRLC